MSWGAHEQSNLVQTSFMPPSMCFTASAQHWNLFDHGCLPCQYILLQRDQQIEIVDKWGGDGKTNIACTNEVASLQ